MALNVPETTLYLKSKGFLRPKVVTQSTYMWDLHYYT